jgi:hypothetical protein
MPGICSPGFAFRDRFDSAEKTAEVDLVALGVGGVEQPFGDRCAGGVFGMARFGDVQLGRHLDFEPVQELFVVRRAHVP